MDFTHGTRDVTDYIYQDPSFSGVTVKKKKTLLIVFLRNKH